MMNWLRKSWRRWFAPSAPDDLEPGPAVAAFLGGDSLRKAVYFHWQTDAELTTASDWPDAIRAMEKALRKHVDALRERIEDLEAELAEAEQEGAEA